MESEEMETFWFFRLGFCRAYDFAYNSDFPFSLDHKLSYDSDYDSDSFASENQTWVDNWFDFGNRVISSTWTVSVDNI